MPENFMDGGEAPEMGQGPQLSEKAREQFKENQKKKQAAIKKIHKEEKKAKFHDNTLSVIITKMLQRGGDDDLVVLLADLIEMNVPSDFIISLLSLYVLEAKDHLNKISENLEKIETNTLIPERVQSLFQEDAKKSILEWGKLIIQNAVKDAEKILETLIDAETWKIQPKLILVSNLIIQKHLAQKGESLGMNELTGFSEAFFSQLLEELQDIFNKNT